MPLPHGYAVLKGRVIRGVPAKNAKEHYSVHVVDDQLDYRIAINVRSTAKNFGKDLYFYLSEDFKHPILDSLRDLPLGRKVFPPGTGAEVRRDSGIALDFIRMNLFDRSAMKLVPGVVAGAHNDLNDRIDDLIQDLVGDEDNLLYAFGEPWINEAFKDKIFGFLPGNGVHDIHMNQGDLTGDHSFEDGVYQDGGLLFYFAATGKYVAYFTKFQSQSWHTDDTSGHAISGSGEPLPPGGHGEGEHGGGSPVGPGNDPDHRVRIVAAMVNPVGPAPEAESVTLLNTTSSQILLDGWSMVDKQKNRMSLDGSLAAGETRRLAVKAPMQLSNSGGIITLLDENGVKVHGVSYTAGEAGREGETIVFRQ